ncbi:unnamed protein product [Rotaria sp. Silwood2]|nr:unnamed protein product [Rotaria sp. Silwood2]
MKRVRELNVSDNNGNELSNIYVILISGIDDSRDQNSSILSYVKFDLEKLINGIKDLPLSFHEKQLKIEIDEPGFKTSALKNTFEFSNVSSGEKVKNVFSMVVKTASGIATAVVSMPDDGLRAVAVAAVNTVHGLSVGALLTTEMCTWSAVFNGKQMYDYLNRFGDDLIFISGHAAMKMIKSNHEIRKEILNRA